MAKGWIKLYRQSTSNPLYFAEPFDKWHAWQDLLLMVNHERKQFISKGQMVTVEPGQTITSIKILADRWHWSVNKVRRFLGILNESGMCTSNGTPNGTTLTIVNWAKFQSEGQADGTTNGTTDGTPNGTADGTLTRMNKNDKERKKRAGARQNSFNNFPQRGYDFDNLEAQLLQAQQRGDVNARDTETAAGSDG